MTGKEKLRLALNHEEGPILLDIGGMPTTGMHCEVMEKVRDFYGLEKRPIKIIEPTQLLGYMDDDLKEAMGVQTTMFWGAGSMFGLRVEDQFKEWSTPWGQEVLVPVQFETTVDAQGNTLLYACGDRDTKPAGKLPVTGKYFDVIDRAPEFDEDDFDLSENTEEYGPIGQADIDWLLKQKEKIGETGDVIMGNLGGTAFGDPALVSGPMLKDPKGMRKLADWYMALASEEGRDNIRSIFDAELKQGLDNLRVIHDAIGDFVDVAYMCGTDFGTQRGPFCSLDTFNDVYRPYYEKSCAWVHENTGWATFKHSCGSIAPFIDPLIDAGFDCLNPVQWTADEMDRQMLKDRFGDRVVFWGGGIDTQKLFPYGTAEQVYDQALECCKIFGKGGGFVFNTIHNIIPGVPAENVDALVRAVRKYNEQ